MECWSRHQTRNNLMRTKLENERELLRKITNGGFKNEYLLYHRQSTDEAESQKNSLEYQKAENTKFAEKEKLHIAQINLSGFCRNGIIAEKHSGFIEDDEIIITEDGKAQFSIQRPKFQQLLLFLSRGYFKGIICLCWDRLSRNRADDTLVRKLMRKGIDFRFAYAKYDQSSAGELHMDIDSMFAAHHSRVTREKVLATIRTSREKGLCTNRAPIGYLNIGSMESKPFDPIRAPIIRRMFELYATGNWSLSDMARWSNEQGLTTNPMRRPRTSKEMLMEDLDINKIPKVSRPITPGTVSRILSSWFYTGRTLDNQGNFIKSQSHEALVSDDLFNSVQRMLKRKNVSVQYPKTLEIPFRGVIRCTDCKRVYTPYVKKGIEYFSSRCTKMCVNTLRNFNFGYISQQICERIRKLAFTIEEIEQIDSKVTTDLVLLEERRVHSLEGIELKKKTIRENLAYLHNNRLTLLKTGVYTPESMIEEENRLNYDLTTLHANEIASDQSMRETMQTIWKLSEPLRDLGNIFSRVTPDQKDEIVRLLISELYISQNTFEIKYKKEFQCFENRDLALGDPTAWLSDLVNNIPDFLDLATALELYIKEHPS